MPMPRGFKPFEKSKKDEKSDKKDPMKEGSFKEMMRDKKMMKKKK